MKKILFATKDPTDTTSFLRAWGAFTEIGMKDYVTPCRYPVTPNWEWDWSNYFQHDIIYLHRPSSPQDRQIIERTKLLGIPLWVDMDDDLQNVPEHNPVYSVYASKQTQDIIEMAIKEADVLSCGGARHAERLRRQYGREITLIPNAVDDRLTSLKKPFQENKRIAWRGSKSHLIDLVAFQEPILQLLHEYPDWEWFFFGQYPIILQGKKYPNVRWGPEINLFEFYVALCTFNAEIQIVPLMDSEFNRVKSNLSWSDATLAGSVAVVPDFEEFQRPGCYSYDSANGFYNRTKELIEHKISGEKLVKNSYEWILDNILLSKINKIRIEIIKNL